MYVLFMLSDSRNHHDITEIVLQVALNTISLTPEPLIAEIVLLF